MFMNIQYIQSREQATTPTLFWEATAEPKQAWVWYKGKEGSRSIPTRRASSRERHRIFSISYSYSNPCWPVLQMAPGSPETSWCLGGTGETTLGKGTNIFM